MRREKIIETPIWQLYQIGQDYHHRENIYEDSDRNYRFYNGDQWYGARLGDAEPVQTNFIKPIVKYKTSVIHSNLFAINFSAENFESQAFQREADRYCKMLNRYAARLWEKDSLDYKLRKITNDAAINDEGIIYVSFDRETNQPVHEVVKKCDIYYANENDEDIQRQPYILIRKRMPVSEAVAYAESVGLSAAETDLIRGDNETFTESGDSAKQEVSDQCTVVYKLYKDEGTVKFGAATRWVTIEEDVDIGISLYPVEHFLWESKEGSARGEGEVRHLIPNQIEVNRTELRRCLVVKSTAYPYKVVLADKVSNPDELNRVGGVIKVRGNTVDDVRKVVDMLQPAQMSADVKLLLDDLIKVTRELAGAGDIATGDVNPESASGRAILAVQQAAQAPMGAQRESLKRMIEGIGRIDLEYLIAYSPDGVQLEEEVTAPNGEKYIQLVSVPQSVLRSLQAVVKVDVTPKGAFDKFAQEQTIENFLLNGLLTPQRVGELRVYAELLDDDAVSPKVKILEACDKIERQQQEIARINAQAQIMRQNAQQFLMTDPAAQAAQLIEAANV